MEFEIEKGFHANDEKRKLANDGMNTTTKSRQNQNTLSKRLLRILGSIGSG